jgi:hypothetical protein
MKNGMVGDEERNTEVAFLKARAWQAPKVEN